MAAKGKAKRGKGKRTTDYVAASAIKSRLADAALFSRLQSAITDSQSLIEVCGVQCYLMRAEARKGGIHGDDTIVIEVCPILDLSK